VCAEKRVKDVHHLAQYIHVFVILWHKTLTSSSTTLSLTQLLW
jgi:hypothetical protein